MFFIKKISESKKGKAVYMWNIKPDETLPITMKNINKNSRFFKPTIIGLKETNELILKMKDHNLQNLWNKIPWWIVKADLGRLLYVYLNGGFYFDVDCKIKKNFLSKIDNNMVLFIEKKLSSVNKLGPREKKTEDRKLRIANYAFGTNVKKHPFLKLVINECLNRLSHILNEPEKNISELDVVWVCGPDVITSIYHDYKNKFNDLLLLDKNYLKHQSFGGWRI